MILILYMFTLLYMSSIDKRYMLRYVTCYVE